MTSAPHPLGLSSYLAGKIMCRGQPGRIVKMKQCFCLLLVGLGFASDFALGDSTVALKSSGK